MELFDSINLYIINHPVLLAQFELLFQFKFWILLILAVYFMSLPYRQRRKDLKEQAELSKKSGHFLA